MEEKSHVSLKCLLEFFWFDALGSTAFPAPIRSSSRFNISPRGTGPTSKIFLRRLPLQHRVFYAHKRPSHTGNGANEFSHLSESQHVRELIDTNYTDARISRTMHSISRIHKQGGSKRTRKKISPKKMQICGAWYVCVNAHAAMAGASYAHHPTNHSTAGHGAK